MTIEDTKWAPLTREEAARVLLRTALPLWQIVPSTPSEIGEKYVVLEAALVAAVLED